MQTDKKTMKTLSLILFVIIIYLAINMGINLNALQTMDTTGMDAAQISLLPIANIVMAVSGGIHILVLLLLAVKGLKESGSPSGDKYHIIFAWIFFVFQVISAINAVSSLFSAANLLLAILDAVISVATVVILFLYAKCGKALRDAE